MSLSIASNTPTDMAMKNEQQSVIFDSSILRYDPNIPTQFIWPDHEKPSLETPRLRVPPIDISAFLSGDPIKVSKATQLIDEACKKHGFFLVVNHGVDLELVAKAHKYMDLFFDMPLYEKQVSQRKLGEYVGYASSFTGRFSSKLPWKETFTFPYSPDHHHDSKVVENYIVNVMGEDFQEFGKVFQQYSEAMNTVALSIMELIGVSLGVGRSYFKEFFKDNDSLLRLNYYPPCQKPDQTLGTGPHCDPTSLTILHHYYPGLEVFVDDKWHSINPIPDSFVVNIGDSFMALSNGIYKSCLHRAVVNKQVARKSLTFFLNPRMDRVITSPNELMISTKLYPNFTWRELLEFTQKHHRAEIGTLEAFFNWTTQHAERLEPVK
ncbi:Isopenicillin N synthase-like, Fe(2+) 2OG dioxygenase domain [Dillenia turbinata]|uniref:Isopenicillin N synthase-like, Fe(2+) 2OG dioxygenase domain n=1 Tax=Dillenia turbinata TaxID=194707 RepID=A0AAN8Z4C3_9MAGN